MRVRAKKAQIPPKPHPEATEVPFPAPIRGIVETRPASQADPLGAEVIENWIPTQRGLRVRGGRERVASVSDPIRALFSYRSGAGNRLLAASESRIFDVTTPATSAIGEIDNALVWGRRRWGQAIWGADAIALLDGLTSGDWATQQIGTSGGDFLVGVNGQNAAILYDGTNLNPLTDTAINEISYDRMTAPFRVGEILAGQTSGASAVILATVRATGATGTAKIGAVSNGPFQAGEILTSVSGFAFAVGSESAASAITLTGVATSDLSHVWLYQNRLFFVQKDSLTAWYLPAGSVGGAALDLSLAGVFRKGGSLLFGGSWSTDSGENLNDLCVFVSDQGEVAVYSGIDPADSSNWSLQGRYDLGGMPIGKLGHFSVGGDFMIATDDGIVPLSSVVRRDPSELSLDAITRDIKRTWKDEVRLTEGGQLVKWTEENMLLSAFPSSTRMLTANLQTGAWATQSGWGANCAAVHNGQGFIGRDDGIVYRIDRVGTDSGEAFTARLCPAFATLNAPSNYKRVTAARATWFSDDDYVPKLGVATDYNAEFATAPNAAPSSAASLVWGSGAWGQKLWSSGPREPRTGKVDLWSSVAGSGHAVAPTLQVTSGGTTRLSLELIQIDVMVEGGGVMT